MRSDSPSQRDTYEKDFIEAQEIKGYIENEDWVARTPSARMTWGNDEDGGCSGGSEKGMGWAE